MRCSPTLDRRKFPAPLRWRAGDAIGMVHGNRDVVSDRAVRSDLIVVSTPSIQLFAGIGKAHEPVRVQASRPELAVECEEEQETVRGTVSPTQDEAYSPSA